MKHIWDDFKAWGASEKNPSAMITYYRCTACGEIAKKGKHDGDCSGEMRFKPMTDKEIHDAIYHSQP